MSSWPPLRQRQVEVPLRTFPLSVIGDAWRAFSASGHRVVLPGGISLR